MKTSEGSQAGTLRGGGGVVQRLKAVAESAADPPEVKLERPVCGSASAAPGTPSFNPPSFLSLAMCLGVAAAAVVVAAVVLMALSSHFCRRDCPLLLLLCRGLCLPA